MQAKNKKITENREKKENTNQKFEKRFERLNPNQKKAVEAISGPVMVVAGPGTGKTEVLGMRTAHILRKTDTRPSEILCLTYTTAGVKAMRQRLVQIIGPDGYQVAIHTFHSFANEVIMDNPDIFGEKKTEPLTDLDQMRILETILRQLPAKHPLFKKTFNSEPKRLKHLFQTMKEENWTTEEIHTKVDEYLQELPQKEGFFYKNNNKNRNIKKGDPNVNKIAAETKKMEALKAGASLFSEYERLLTQQNQYEFIDMLRWVKNAFETKNTLLQKYQEQFQYFLVDEYQDTNNLQNSILLQLANFWEDPNIFIVGDDDQSIYRFQGANLRNILAIKDVYPNVKIIPLTQNYRSTQKVLDLATKVISKNKERLIHELPNLEKDLIASNTSITSHKSQIMVTPCPSSSAEAEFIAQSIEADLKNNIKPHEIAVVFQKHAQADPITSLLTQKKIPFSLKRRQDILKEPFFHQILGVLQYLLKESTHPGSAHAELFVILHAPWFGLSPKTIAKLHFQAQNARKLKKDQKETIQFEDTFRAQMLKPENSEQLQKVAQFLEDLIVKVKTQPANFVFQSLLYGNTQENYQNTQNTAIIPWLPSQKQSAWYLRILKAIFEALFAHSRTFANKNTEKTAKQGQQYHLSDFLDYIHDLQLYGIRLEVPVPQKSTNGVQFVTAHSSKGLEFEKVYLIGANSNIWDKKSRGSGRFSFPESLTQASAGFSAEEARRLWFVVMTRAKKDLIISYAEQNDSGKALQPSCFVAEMLVDEEESEFIHKIEDTNQETEDLLPYFQEKPLVGIWQSPDDYKKRLETYVLSASAVNTFLDCPKKWYFQHFLRIPSGINTYLAFGSSIHASLEQLFSSKNKNKSQFPENKDIINTFEHKMAKYASVLPEKDVIHLLKHGKATLEVFLNHTKPIWQQQTMQCQTEKAFLTHFEANSYIIPFKGSIDRFDFLPEGKFRIIDYKTGKWKPEKVKSREKIVNGGPYWRQMGLYALMMQQNPEYAGKFAAAQVVFVEKDEKKGFILEDLTYSAEDFTFFKALLEEIWRKITSQDLSGGCDDCMWCKEVKNQ